MAYNSIGADSALCNSNIIDFRQARRKRAMQSGSRPDLDMAIAIARETRARHDFLSAANTVQGLLGVPVEAGYPAIHREWELYRAQIFSLAQIPVRNAQERRRKHAAIGKVWLRAEGEWYDRLREFLARDEKLKRGY